MSFSLLQISASVLAVCTLAFWLRTRNTHPLPPGPKRLPLIGNVLDLPAAEMWVTINSWRKEYGDIIYVDMLGHRMVFLNSFRAATDLFDKRSTSYSDKPDFPMLGLMGWDWAIPTMRYGERHRKHRALLHTYLQPSAVKDYVGIQTHQVHRMLESIIKSPDDILEHIRSAVGATIMMITYGHEVAPEKDTFITLADTAIRPLSHASQPGAFLVDLFPWLKHVPAWVPGAGFKTKAKGWRELAQTLLHTPYVMTRDKIRAGTARPSMMSQMLEANTATDGRIRDEDTIRSCTANLYFTGSDTMVSSIQSFVLAAVLQPEIQRRAQAELDRVVGRHRLPTLADRGVLPYVDAIVKEALRWYPVTPLAGPRRATADEVYDGYLIPAGTTVFSNLWAILRDEQEYPDPATFKPERWLPADAAARPRDSNRAAFGFGRRSCPGRYLAENTIFIAIASILAAFDIEKARDNDGKPITPTVKYFSGLISHPAPFPCVVTPRSAEAVALVRQTTEAGK